MADNINTRLYARTYNPPVRTPSPAPQQPTVCAPACETCGLLECLCRPRFFAGQLLTDTDLNRLDAYIRAKNRMHNLQLHGWGVVNGLQVRCDACSTGVIVGTGYAIDPCGEDIVVCKDSPVDICSLIKRCQQQDITCVPSSRNNFQTNCDDVEEDWVLAIRYTETQARAITALRSTPSCACGAKGGSCSCGGSCGCGAKMTSTAPTNAMTTTTTQKPRNTPTECEATAICEGYSWDVFLAPTEIPPKEGQTQLSGGIIDAINCCIEPFMASLPQRPTTPIDQSRDQWYLWCCRMKAALIAFFTSGPQANCTAVTTLQSIECPSTNDQDFVSKINAAGFQYVELELEALFACFCAALLPPAPCGTSDDRVPLAIVTVRKKDCKVLRVCNWTHLRKLVITWPTLEYWFGWIPWFKTLQDSIAKFCCADFTYRQGDATGVYTNNVASPDAAYMKVNPQIDPQLAQENQTMSALISSAFARGNAAVDPAAILGLESKTPLADVEKSNLAPFLLLNQLARPMVASAVPTDLQARVAVLEKMVGDMAKKQGNKK